MSKQQITREHVEQAAKEKGIELMTALTMMQGACAKIGDVETLERLCEIKAEILGL